MTLGPTPSPPCWEGEPLLGSGSEQKKPSSCPQGRFCPTGGHSACPKGAASLSRERLKQGQGCRRDPQTHGHREPSMTVPSPPQVLCSLGSFFHPYKETFGCAQSSEGGSRVEAVCRERVLRFGGATSSNYICCHPQFFPPSPVNQDVPSSSTLPPPTLGSGSLTRPGGAPHPSDRGGP